MRSLQAVEQRARGLKRLYQVRRSPGDTVVQVRGLAYRLVGTV